MFFRYVAVSPQGRKVSGRIEAPSQESAIAALRAQSLRPIAINNAKRFQLKSTIHWGTSTSLSLSIWSQICGVLADLLSAGVPLSDALNLARERVKSRRAKTLLDRVYQKVRNGTALSQAFSYESGATPRLLTALVSAGEASGTLAQSFQTLATTFSDMTAFKKDLVSQVAYPLALCAMLAVAILFLSFSVLPQFEDIFESSQTQTPPITSFVLSAAELVRTLWQAPILALMALLLAVKLAKPTFVRIWESVCLSTPVLNGFLRKYEFERFARALGALTHGGSPLAVALNISTSAVTHSRLRRALEQSADRVKNGSALTQALRTNQSWPKDALTLIEIGERTGQLGAMTLKAADLCASDVRSTLKSIAGFAGPALTALMGALVAGVVAAVVVGVLSLNEAIY